MTVKADVSNSCRNELRRSAWAVLRGVIVSRGAVSVGEILGVGLSHFPGFIFPDDEMSSRLKILLETGRIPEELRDPASWPAPMREEWGDDEGATAATKHRNRFLVAARRVRAAVDEFRPDSVIVFGDDQYENFHEDSIPTFGIYIRDQFETKPFARSRGGGNPRPNVWGRDPQETVIVPSSKDTSRHLAKGLIEAGFDLCYAYTGNHLDGLGHAFMNTVLYLDYDRTGWNYPLIPIHVNAYGAQVVRQHGGSAAAGVDVALDPPAPTPRRCFDLGRALARLIMRSDLRAVLVGSSSWSHAFLTGKTGYLHPDIESDQQRFAELATGRYEVWAELDGAQLEAAGQHELLNWVPLIGAMYEIGAGKPDWSDLVSTYVLNSSKPSVVFPAIKS